MNKTHIVQQNYFSIKLIFVLAGSGYQPSEVYIFNFQTSKQYQGILFSNFQGHLVTKIEKTCQQ